MPVHVIVPVIIPIAKTITHICNWIIRINYQRLGSLSFFCSSSFTYVQQDHQDQQSASLGRSHRPHPRTPPPPPQRAPGTRQSCTGESCTTISFQQLWVLARLTSSISYWWFVNGGKSVKCIRKLADEDILLSPCHKMGGFNKVCIFVLFPLREK